MTEAISSRFRGCLKSQRRDEALFKEVLTSVNTVLLSYGNQDIDSQTAVNGMLASACHKRPSKDSVICSNAGEALAFWVLNLIFGKLASDDSPHLARQMRDLCKEHVKKCLDEYVRDASMIGRRPLPRFIRFNIPSI